MNHGPIVIRGNSSLTDMSGLANLERVVGPIVIEDNPNLTVSLPGLLEAGSLSVFRNGVIEGDAFDALEAVSAELNFGGEGPPVTLPALRSTGSFMIRDDGPERVDLPVLERVENDVWILNVPGMVTLSAPLLWRARTLHIEGASALTTLELPSLSTLVRDLTIHDNAALPSLAGLASLTSGLRRLEITDNAALTNVDGLRKLGDALGSDPIVHERCDVAGNQNASAALAALVQFLSDKFPGQALFCS